MVRPEDITGYLDNKWFASLGELGSYITTVMISAMCLVLLWFLWNYLEHKLKIIVFPVYGADSGELKDLEDIDVDDISKMLNVQLGKPFRLKGKHVKVKGIKKFSILKKNMVIKKIIKDVDFEYCYPEGIWMLNPSKDIYIPIKRPALEDTVNLKVPDTDMDMWQANEEENVRRRTQDEDLMKKQLYMSIAIIIGAFALAALIIWLSMSFAGKSIDNALTEIKPVADSLSGLKEIMGGGSPPG